MIVTPIDQKGYEAIEELIDLKLNWVNDEKVEWGKKSRKRGNKGKSAKTAQRTPQKERSEKTSRNTDKLIGQSTRKSSVRGRDDQVGEIIHTDSNHAFGGEENIPAFLR